MVAGAEVVIGDGGGGSTEGGSLCCINKFMFQSIELLKDLRDDSKVFFISKLVSMHSTRNLFSIVSSRLTC